MVSGFEMWDEPSERLRDLETLETAPDLTSPFLALPGLRGFWPTSSREGTPNMRVMDLSGLEMHLDNIAVDGAVTSGYENLVPFISLPGGGPGGATYLQHIDDPVFDIIGNESWIGAAYWGLTIGGWFKIDDLGAEEGLMSKENGAGQRSYYLYKTAADNIEFTVSSNGVAVFTVTSTGTILADTWYFIVGRYDPSTELAVFINNVKTTNVVAIPATLFNSTANFRIGFITTSFSADMLLSLCFLSAMQLSDGIIDSLYAQERGAFGV